MATKYIVAILTTNRYGGLEDREITVRAASEAEAQAKVQARHPRAFVTWVGEAE